MLLDWEGLVSGRAWFDNGKTILFGLVGGYFGVELAKAILEVKVKTGDSFAVPVAAAVAVGRLACFVGGCCFGKPTSLPWGVVFHDGIRRHPTQLYEAAFHASAAVFLAWTERRGLFRLQRIKLYLIAYLVYRFFTEFIRPEPIVALGLTAYQWGALALLPVFAWLWHRDARARSIELEHVLAAVRRVADQRAGPQVHDEVELLQRELADEDRCIVGDFHDIHGADSPLDGQPHGVVNTQPRTHRRCSAPAS